MYNLHDINQRKQIVEDLNNFVNGNFEEPYNIFVFGSFLTNDFCCGKSDLDVAIYTKGDMMSLDMLVQEFMKNINIDLDVIWLHPECNSNYIDLAPLQGHLCTDYYPEELQKHFMKLIFAFQRELEYRTKNYNLLCTALERSIIHG